MSKRIRIFSTVGLLCMLILAVFEVPVAASKDQIDPNSEESVFSLTQVFNKLSFLEVKDKRTKESISFPAQQNTTVLLNGKPAHLCDLHNGDDLSLTFEHGTLSVIQAIRTTAGILLASDCHQLTYTADYVDRHRLTIAPDTIVEINGKRSALCDAKRGDSISIKADSVGEVVQLDIIRQSPLSMLWDNFRRNLFKPLLLFFMVGLAIPILRIALEFPSAVYQGFTIYLLISIGWHGGEELAVLSRGELSQAAMFMCVGFITNTIVACLAYFILRVWLRNMRKVDCATIAAYYGSDSAGTFLTCLGTLQVAGIAFASYMPVMLAIMEIPGCLVGLYMVQQLRKRGMNAQGLMPEELNNTAINLGVTEVYPSAATNDAKCMALEVSPAHSGPAGFGEVLREVFLNPGLFLLLSGIAVGFISRLQGPKIVEVDDALFINLFQGILCLFLLEMGMTAAKRIKDLKHASWRFIAFGLVAPNIFAMIGLTVCHLFSLMIHQPFALGTYALFAVLCGSSSYIAVPAIQRLAIQEASPTLPLAASLGLTFVYNVTAGIPLYLFVAQQMLTYLPLPA